MKIINLGWLFSPLPPVIYWQPYEFKILKKYVLLNTLENTSNKSLFISKIELQNWDYCKMKIKISQEHNLYYLKTNAKKATVIFTIPYGIRWGS